MLGGPVKSAPGAREKSTGRGPCTGDAQRITERPRALGRGQWGSARPPRHTRECGVGECHPAPKLLQCAAKESSGCSNMLLCRRAAPNGGRAGALKNYILLGGLKDM